MAFGRLLLRHLGFSARMRKRDKTQLTGSHSIVLRTKRSNAFSNVISAPSLHRQLPVTVVQSDPDLYVFLVRHPEVVVNMWDILGITKVSINRTADYAFDARDGAGTACQVELVYGRSRHTRDVC